MFPQELIEATEYLQNRITASNQTDEGRVNSTFDETQIIDALLQHFGPDVIKRPETRHFCDVLIHDYRVQIKSTQQKGSQSDNASAKKALLWVFTGLDDNDNKSRWSYFIQRLSQGPIDTGRNYYYLVLNKDTGQITLNSILTLAKVTSNGSNLPFQIPWRDNTSPVERTFTEAFRFLIDATKESIRKSIERMAGYENL